MALDFSSLWDYSKPELSEQRFRAALATASRDDALVLQTQIARSYGLRTDFARAQEILASIKDQVSSGSAEAQVRYHLELGRTYASAAHPPEAQTSANKELARLLYTAAFEIAEQSQLDYLAIDALHMLAVVETELSEQLAWNLKAITYMQESSQTEARIWEASLRNNIGYTKHLLGQYDEAIIQFRLCRAAHELTENAANIRVADWMIAWTLRAQGKFQEAIAIQLRLEQEWEQAGEPDPYVFEELEHLYRATQDTIKADSYAAKLLNSKQQ